MTRQALTEPDILVLDRNAVRAGLAGLDPVAVVEAVLREHAAGHTVLPAEAYLPWTNAVGASARCVAMPAAVVSGRRATYGLKVINASLSNPGRGLDRAGGITLLFDPETARPHVLADAALLSAVRTAAYTVASLRHLGPEVVDAVTMLGCGALARAHLELLARYVPELRTVHVYDVDQQRATRFARWAGRAAGVDVVVERTARAAVGATQVLVTLTTSDEPYLAASWLRPGTFVAHVSLDDLCRDVFTTAEAVYVDDVDLVRDNPRRVLGRLMSEGVVTAPGSPVRSIAGCAVSDARPLTGTLAGVLAGTDPVVRPGAGTVVSNPFGAAVLDVALLAAVVAQLAPNDGHQRLRLA